PIIDSVATTPVQDKQINADYSIKNNQVYYQDKALANANPAKFMIVSEKYSSDGVLVFHEDKLIEGVDVKTFNVLPGTEYASDINFIYHPQYPDGTIGKIALIKNSADKPEIIGRTFARYQNKVYCGSYELAGADAASFQSMSQFYAKDSQKVYSADCVILDGLNASSAALIKEMEKQAYIKDAQSVFFLSKKIEGADPSSFTVLNNGYAKDAHAFYFNETVTTKENFDTNSLKQ
ncbi:MAG: DKNYY domain-containing protein, partial [Candidatus Falkowbacteria bacterium]|nr:DKNYY domain-containing protein [Candidatus Falkowbacteria bacterium]